MGPHQNEPMNILVALKYGPIELEDTLRVQQGFSSEQELSEDNEARQKRAGRIRKQSLNIKD